MFTSKVRLYIAIGASVLIMFTACQNPNGNNTTYSTGVSLSNTGYNLEVGQGTGQLSATVSPSSANQSVNWSTASSSIVTVNGSGVISPVSAGTAMITATAADGKSSSTCGVAVWGNSGSGGYLQYYSADPAFYGWSFFHCPGSSQSATSTFTTVSVTVEKLTGYTNAPYGIVFCEQNSNNYYALFITSTQDWEVQKVVNGTATLLKSWTKDTTDIHQSGTNNLLEIDPVSGIGFNVKINGTQVGAFSDTTFTAGRVGFWGQNDSSTNESFPSVPENIQFKITSPISYP